MITALPPAVELARDLVGPPLRTAVERLAPPVRLVAGYHLGWWEADGTPATGGGKRLRAALALLSAQAAGAPAEAGLPAAVAVELVHNFSLLHDDVMDGDPRRRHRPTAAAAFGIPLAILAGDALLALAADVLAEEPPPGAWTAYRFLGETTQQLIAGQAADLAFERRDEVGLDECLAMAEQKTAALFSCAVGLGAQLVAAPPELQSGLVRFGRHLGLAFQLVDDLLGIWGAPAVTGKPVFSDLRARKKTVPVVVALTSGTAPGERLRRIYGHGRVGEPEIVAGLVEDAGGRAWTESEASRLLREAQRCLDALDMPAHVRAELHDVARFVVEREY